MKKANKMKRTWLAGLFMATIMIMVSFSTVPFTLAESVDSAIDSTSSSPEISVDDIKTPTVSAVSPWIIGIGIVGVLVIGGVIWYFWGGGSGTSGGGGGTAGGSTSCVTRCLDAGGDLEGCLKLCEP